MRYLRTTPKEAVIKCRTDSQYKDIDECILFELDEIIQQYFLKGNYISGTVYNRKIVTNYLIEEMKRLYEGDEGYCKLIRDIYSDDVTKQMMYLLAADKTAFLIHVVKHKYLEAKEDWTAIEEYSKKSIIETVEYCEIPEIFEEKEGYKEHLSSIIAGRFED